MKDFKEFKSYGEWYNYHIKNDIELKRKDRISAILYFKNIANK